ncbi:MAG: Fis family transcriptional regulator [Candidatus Odinarchaeum yellowstonii]|uniref:Fis family transcriptional regulator n=1 Tax=Odinarchaeota yellowstonii (strain LCB_4) TaxID=1841599 RepID=A0AAF0D2P3_ODILC|nr:MAG: Fis family transcriptional regulator [Candidatus Odinarchaeum yellowstonii]
MSAPCEFAVKYLYPLVRSEIARFLIKNFKLTQIQVAEKLGITQAAVSQYTSLKRGGRVEKIPERILKIVKDSVAELCAPNSLEKLSNKSVEIMVCIICKRIKKLNSVD